MTRATSGPEGAPDAATGFGHGKVILLGEHAVVFGEPAVAAGLARGIRALVLPSTSPGKSVVRIPAWNTEAAAGDGSAIGTALQRLLSHFGAPDVDVEVEPDLPPRAGLGSSAAMAVAIARALAARAGAGTAGVVAAVADAESVFHRSPSGIDAAAAMSGGVGLFDKATGWREVRARQGFDVAIGLTGKPRDTGLQVEAVARLVARTPVARRLVETLGEVSRAGVATLELGDIDGLGRLLDVAHGLLAGLGVSSPELDDMVHAARAAGAIGAKLTGAGGGGAVIAIAPGHEDDVLRRWRALGFDGFRSRIADPAAAPGAGATPAPGVRATAGPRA